MAQRDGQKDQVLKIHVELGGKVYHEDLASQSQVALDVGGLNQALAEHPGRFAWWAMMEVIAREQLDHLTSELEQLDAKLFNFYQSKLSIRVESEKKSKPTLEAIRSHIILDKNHQSLSQRARQAKRDLEKLTVGRQAMLHRKDSLLAIASNMRAEMDHRLYVMKRDMSSPKVQHVGRR